MLTDFHIHTTFSDGKHSLSDVINFYGQRGFGAIAITDHLCETKHYLGRMARYLNKTLTVSNFSEYQNALLKESNRAWKEYQMIVYSGFEITKNSFDNHRSAHILALNCKKFISADQSIDQILMEIKSEKALTVAAHPVHTRKLEKQTYHLWDRREELKSLFDAWEVASGPIIFDEVQKSQLPMVANSDLHRFEQINSWKSYLFCEKDSEEILNAIRDQKISFMNYQEKMTPFLIYKMNKKIKSFKMNYYDFKKNFKTSIQNGIECDLIFP